MVFKDDKMLFSKYDDEAKMFWKREETGGDNGMFANREFVLPEGFELREVQVKECYETIEKYLREWEGYGDDNFLGDEYGRWTNPNAQWDWWTIGGRWENTLLLKDGTSCDQAVKGNVDFVTNAKRAVAEGEIRYDKIHSIINGRTLSTWKESRERFGDDITAAREFYNGQEVIMDLRAHERWIEADAYMKTREEYLTECSNSANSTFAVLQDGVWKQRGDMGWWGCVSDENDNWTAKFQDVLDGIPDDKFITIVDCHI
jgi:hypothetical protein